MKSFAKHLSVAVLCAAFAFVLTGCSGQQNASSEAEQMTPAQQEATALEPALACDGFQSVTMQMQGSTSIDKSATTATSSSSASSASGAAGDADEMQDEAYDDYGDGDSNDEYAEYDESGDYDEYAEYDEYGEYGDEYYDEDGEEASQGVTTHVDILAKCDRSGEKTRMQTTTHAMGYDVELYVNGSDAVLFFVEQAVGATLEQLGMTEYADIISLIRWQGGDVTQFMDAVQDVQTETDGDITVYTVTCDPAKYVAANAGVGAFEQMGKAAKLDTAKLVYRVNADGLLAGVSIDVSGTGVAHKIDCTFSDYNATDVENGPEPTMSYREMTTGQSDDEADGETDEDSGEGYEDYGDYADSEDYADYDDSADGGDSEDYDDSADGGDSEDNE